MLPQLIVFGDKTANEILETARLAHGGAFSKLERVYFSEPDFSEVVVPTAAKAGCKTCYIVGMADVDMKKAINDRLQGLNWTPFSVVHPTSVICPSASIGQGVYVGALAVVSSNARVGNHSIIHLHASVGHDSVIGDYCAVLPGARVSGCVKVGDRSLIGSNAFINAGVRIGEDCQIDALTYLARDLEQGNIMSVRVGKPLKRIHSRGKD